MVAREDSKERGERIIQRKGFPTSSALFRTVDYYSLYRINMVGGALKGGVVGKVIWASDMEKITVNQLKSLKEQSDL